MNFRPTVQTLLAGLTVSAALCGCGETADQKASPTGPASNSAPSATAPPAEAGKGPAEPAPAAGTSAPVVIDQPAAPSATPADAAKDKSKSTDEGVKKETPPKGA